MRKSFIMVLATFLLLGYTSQSKASATADFWAVDTGHNGVSLDFSLLSTPAVLWYSTDKTNWVQLFDATAPVSLQSTSLKLKDTTHLYLELDPVAMLSSAATKSLSAPATPKLSFVGGDTDNLYNSLIVQWSGDTSLFPINFITAKGADKLASKDPAPTPIPSAALLLGSGLIGFIGVRRRNRLTEA